MTSPALPHVPGILGHVVWILASIVSYGMLLGLYAGSLGAVVIMPLLVLTFGAIYAVPVGVVGALITSLACRSVADQVVHVAVACACGLVGGAFVWGVFFHSWPFGTPAVLVAVAAGTGRATVIPLVNRRRDRSPFRGVSP